MKRHFGPEVTAEQRALREFLYRVIARHFSEEISGNPEEAREPEESLRIARSGSKRTRVEKPLLVPTILLSAATFLYGTDVRAHDHHETAALVKDEQQCEALAASGLTVQDGDADIQVVQPAEGEIIRSHSFPVLYTMSGDLVTPRLDHVHWQLSDGFNNTSPDLSGVIDVEAEHDGDHTMTVYMATPEHVPIGVKRIVHFKIITMGAVLLAPSREQTVTSNDVPVSYSMYGEPPADANVQILLDSQPVVLDSDRDGSVVLRGLTDGAHTVTVKLVDAANNQVGESGTVSFSVKSTLNVSNAKKGYSIADKFLRAKSDRDKKKLLGQLKPLLALMQTGGTTNAADPQLTAANVKKATALLAKITKKPSDTKSAKSLRTLLSQMMR